MATNIPGRRISFGETLYTDWGPRGGDCALLRAQMLIKGSSGTIRISMETRSEEDTAATSMDTSWPSSAPKLLDLGAAGVKTAVYTAIPTSGSPARGLKEQYRLKIAFNGGSAGDYHVVRIFPPVFFDNAVPGS